jgi:hypothetical protein
MIGRVHDVLTRWPRRIRDPNHACPIETPWWASHKCVDRRDAHRGSGESEGSRSISKGDL